MNKYHQCGLSLLELLIASALGTLVIAGLISIYLSIKSNSNRQQVLMEMQDAGRFAVMLLNQRIRTAGFVGCADAAHPVDQDQAIMGYSSNLLPSFLQNQVVPGTDAVVIRGCVSLTQIAENSQVVSMAYFIGDTHRTNAQGQPILALFQKPMDGDREELAPGVEQMQILYGAGNPPGFAYYAAAQVVDWQSVRSLRIDLLINSIDNLLTHPQTYYFHGRMILPNDLLWHNAWSTSIGLRERSV